MPSAQQYAWKQQITDDDILAYCGEDGKLSDVELCKSLESAGFDLNTDAKELAESLKAALNDLHDVKGGGFLSPATLTRAERSVRALQQQPSISAPKLAALRDVQGFIALLAHESEKNGDVNYLSNGLAGYTGAAEIVKVVAAAVKTVNYPNFNPVDPAAVKTRIDKIIASERSLGFDVTTAQLAKISGSLEFLKKRSEDIRHRRAIASDPLNAILNASSGVLVSPGLRAVLNDLDNVGDTLQKMRADTAQSRALVEARSNAETKLREDLAARIEKLEREIKLEKHAGKARQALSPTDAKIVDEITKSARWPDLQYLEFLRDRHGNDGEFFDEVSNILAATSGVKINLSSSNITQLINGDRFTLQLINTNTGSDPNNDATSDAIKYEIEKTIDDPVAKEARVKNIKEALYQLAVGVNQDLTTGKATVQFSHEALKDLSVGKTFELLDRTGPNSMLTIVDQDHKTREAEFLLKDALAKSALTKKNDVLFTEEYPAGTSKDEKACYVLRGMQSLKVNIPATVGTKSSREMFIITDPFWRAEVRYQSSAGIHLNTEPPLYLNLRMPEDLTDPFADNRNKVSYKGVAKDLNLLRSDSLDQATEEGKIKELKELLYGESGEKEISWRSFGKTHKRGSLYDEHGISKEWYIEKIAEERSKIIDPTPGYYRSLSEREKDQHRNGIDDSLVERLREKLLKEELAKRVALRNFRRATIVENLMLAAIEDRDTPTAEMSAGSLSKDSRGLKMLQEIADPKLWREIKSQSELGGGVFSASKNGTFPGSRIEPSSDFYTWLESKGRVAP